MVEALHGELRQQIRGRHLRAGHVATSAQNLKRRERQPFFFAIEGGGKRIGAVSVNVTVHASGDGTQ